MWPDVRQQALANTMVGGMCEQMCGACTLPCRALLWLCYVERTVE